MRVYEVRPRRDRRGFDLISDVLPFGRLWYGDPMRKGQPPQRVTAPSVAQARGLDLCQTARGLVLTQHM